ncbi:acetyl-CoA synthetase-like protein [Lenzites betulinus]|nr:acetyl-CoA synthetase-like protein [Lenzites betulinus]
MRPWFRSGCTPPIAQRSHCPRASSLLWSHIYSTHRASLFNFLDIVSTMAGERTRENHYLSLVIPSFQKCPDAPAFRPYLGRDDAWGTVTYRELEAYLAVAQAHWKAVLAPLDLAPLSVVGFWLTGRKLTDLVNTIAVSSLGYTPQFFSGHFDNVGLIFSLLAKSGGKALVFDAATFEERIAAIDPLPVPHFPSLELDDLARLVAAAAKEEEGATGERLVFRDVAPVALDDLAALFHSSGTTGALPKIIPNTFRMLRAVLTAKFLNVQYPLETGQQGVINTLGSLAHIGSFHCFIGAISIGQCVAQSSGMAIPPPEFVGLANLCKLTILVLYAPFLSTLIRAAQKDPAVKDALLGLNQVCHTGVALNKEDEEWAYANGVRIMTSYGTTETGPMMRSRLGSDASSRLLRPIKGTTSVFIPHSDQDKGASGLQLYELVVPAGAADCPPAEFCAPDGFYHTNDLFEKVEDGWVYRGRANDWIKIVIGFCDTKTIEDGMRALGPDLVHDVVVIGSGRQHACLAVEAAEGDLDDEKRQRIAETIVQRAGEFNKRVFPHERVEHPERIIVVEKGVLPRTKEKGNIRRAATEEMFSEVLDRIAM